MSVREVVEIDQEKCDGCGDCITACAEGAIQLIDGKAQLVSDVYCDGLGACLGHCPQDAITITRRDADAFDEIAVEKRLATLAAESGPGRSSELPVTNPGPPPAMAGGCPGSRVQDFSRPRMPASEDLTGAPSALRQWPIQLHLVPPTAPFFHDADVLLAADCVPFALGGFHGQFLNGHALAIACPKLDSHQEIYVEKLAAMIDQAQIRSLRVAVMEVPCCSGLVRLATTARDRATRDVPVSCVVIGVQGNVLGEHSL